ncbi:hypothetical protein BKA70DRAFT_465787 [Coprinopsis sp. MPI-PUGE-AT-0042]|nr:hypothetical protein BKA70DRAFT_465787 [Coprinopsis sp. MPI-PUGE-AT-0042]
MNEPITKRVHIAGLTPAITADDISKRLSTFGTVKSVEGVGLLDGLGQPRKFGYVTIETTTGKLARCMNVLSGSTWKGAKLRLGEAKPDYAARIAAENEDTEPSRPRKRLRLDGVHSQDMSLIDAENVEKRGAWKKTSLGRLLRPVRMRPEHPLPPTLEELALMKKEQKRKATKTGKERKPKLRPPPVRARARKIDMTKWGSTQLKGIFLESQGVGPGKVSEFISEFTDPASDTSADEDEEVSESPPKSSKLPNLSPSPASAPSSPASKEPKPTASLPPDNLAPSPSSVDLVSEKQQTLGFLASLFAADDEWEGRESVGSDIDEEELLKGDRLSADAPRDDDIEFVPSTSATASRIAPVASPAQVSEDEDDEESEADPADPKPKELKDIFAPRNDEGGFSLLGHLNLDLEFDEDLPFAIGETAVVPAPVFDPAPAFQPTPTVTAASTSTVTYINPKQPLFFPLPRSDDVRARQRDIWDVIKDNRWDWMDPSTKFYRTATEDEIRKEWEEKKGDLTRDWKKRAREAGKMNRKRKGGAEGDADV